MTAGPYEPSWDGLAGYATPDWFHRAKFGVWAHWGPQCQPEAGDWYAKNMYVPGSRAQETHLERFGHPSEVGFKDVIHQWRGERWDPEKIVRLFSDAGARYVVAMANHHDNLDLWASRHHRWNSVDLGPRRDIVGEWAAAARAAGLPFGVSIHASHAWTWYEPSRGCDAEGPRAGVPYDGGLTAADGAGTWWEGLDPQELYAQNHPVSEGFGDLTRSKYQWAWGEGASRPDADYCRRFHDRTIDLINQVNPDLVYFDDTALPLWPVSDAGLRIAAHLYNQSHARHGENRAVLLGKALTEDQKECLTWDIERGAPDAVQPRPWQTDTCIGHWHYDRQLAEQHGYKSALTVVRTLADVVAKNGNLLLSVPLRGDGTPDADEVEVLGGIGSWLRRHGEAIFDTAPFHVAGEGPSLGAARPLRGPGFNEGTVEFTARDVRYTRTDGAVYAIHLDRPDEPVSLTALGRERLGHRVRSVTWLGVDPAPTWTQRPDSLDVSPPPRRDGDPEVLERCVVLRVDLDR
ncbi:alpha-L-fucosidase [Isoptericola sp. NPDC019693]|uniref:alpha-L-fucosidase n=1 Tax=Isoptericola sp. NPDC019693 TaxID=3364009 RepID=UPI00379CF0D2